MDARWTQTGETSWDWMAPGAAALLEVGADGVCWWVGAAAGEDLAEGWVPFAEDGGYRLGPEEQALESAARYAEAEIAHHLNAPLVAADPVLRTAALRATYRPAPQARFQATHGELVANATGWQIVHCGHPTALWPYYLAAPGEDWVVVSHNGYGFTSRRAAQGVVEGIVAGRFTVSGDRCVGRTRRVLEVTALGELLLGRGESLGPAIMDSQNEVSMPEKKKRGRGRPRQAKGAAKTARPPFGRCYPEDREAIDALAAAAGMDATETMMLAVRAVAARLELEVPARPEGAPVVPSSWLK